MKKLLLIALLAIALVGTLVACTGEQPVETVGDTVVDTEPETVDDATTPETLPESTPDENTIPEGTTESAPAETKPAETQPEETKPADTQPEETQPEQDPPVEHDYVADGLVSMYGGGEGSVWVDQIGSNDVELTIDDNNQLTADGLRVQGMQHYFPEAIVDLVNGEAFTVEILFGDFVCLGQNFNTFMNSQNDNFALFRRVNTNELEFKFAANPGSERPKISGAETRLPNSLITVTYTVGGDCVIYINGREAAVKPSPAVMGANDLFIGHTDPAKDYDALYRCIRFYDRALSAEQVQANAAVDGFDLSQPSVDPVEMSKADIFELAVQEGKPVDISANALPITVLGAPAIEGESHTFGGQPDNYKIADFKNHYANMQDGFTLEVSLTTGADIVTKSAPVANFHAGGCGIEIVDSYVSFTARFAGTYLTVEAPVEADTTYHLTAVYDATAGEIRLYVNGKVADSLAVSGSLDMTVEPGAQYLCIGADSDATGYGENFFAGSIHDVRIYGEPASAGNALWLWQQMGT